MLSNTSLVFTLLLAAISSHVRAAPLDGPPQQNPDGSCFSYLVQSGDYCDKIRIDHNIASLSSFDQWNANTWAWNGCANLQSQSIMYILGNVHLIFTSENYTMCLSPGTPPLPVANQYANCVSKYKSNDLDQF